MASNENMPSEGLTTELTIDPVQEQPVVSEEDKEKAEAVKNEANSFFKSKAPVLATGTTPSWSTSTGTAFHWCGSSEERGTFIRNAVKTCVEGVDRDKGRLRRRSENFRKIFE